ncbi:LysR substrate-binding domain-containing protein [Rhizobium sp. CSW-27]|uniref:LysR substrate-binding domain-containing protein n=1 Tax=Rhizobium sp. CSW-27 TaxID=2839985 RepID=UPI002078A9A9|nr:LysR substrate-binding domain-containing protein [Rhizobium sp. CSW-27]
MEKQNNWRRQTFELDVLRTFVTGVELNSFIRAGDRLGRSASAISLQMRKLEEQVGQPLLRRQGRGLVPTEAGELLLGYARRLLQLNDETFAALSQSATLDGHVRLGIPEDLAETWLAPLLARFAEIHPRVRLEARVDSSRSLQSDFESGRLDLALTWASAGGMQGRVVAEMDMVWIGHPEWRHDHETPVPLVLFDPPCAFRERATASLDRAGIAWWPAFTSRSLTGLHAAVRAGLGLTARIKENVPAGLSTQGAGLPKLGAITLALHADAEATPAVRALQREILERLPAKP